MDNLIKQAKQTDITTLYKGELKQSGKALTGKCPLHDDNNASFAIYPETNSFYCFTEGIGGDVIKLYQLLYKVDFKETIRRLNH